MNPTHVDGRRHPFVIGGWLPGIGAIHHSVGALLVGAHRVDGLQFCGVVGAGISGAQRRLLLRELLAYQRNNSPFSSPIPDFIAHHPRWVTTRLVGDIEYRELAEMLRLHRGRACEPTSMPMMLCYPSSR